MHLASLAPSHIPDSWRTQPLVELRYFGPKLRDPDRNPLPVGAPLVLRPTAVAFTVPARPASFQPLAAAALDDAITAARNWIASTDEPHASYAPVAVLQQPDGAYYAAFIGASMFGRVSPPPLTGTVYGMMIDRREFARVNPDVRALADADGAVTFDAAGAGTYEGQ